MQKTLLTSRVRWILAHPMLAPPILVNPKPERMAVPCEAATYAPAVVTTVLASRPDQPTTLDSDKTIAAPDCCASIGTRSPDGEKN